MSRDMIWGAICLLAGLMLGAFLHGCASTGLGTPSLRTGQEQAVYIVWVETYRRTDRPPLVRWVEGDSLSCTDPDSSKPGFPVPLAFADDDGNHWACREGLTWSPVEVLVAWHGEASFADTALAHELLHVVRLRSGDFHDHHKEADFFPVVDTANAAVRAAGR